MKKIVNKNIFGIFSFLLFLMVLSSCSILYYTVAFYVVEGDTPVTAQKIQKSGLVNKPNDPIRDGYEFLGWFLDDIEWDFAFNTVNDNIILVAKWEKIILPEMVTLTFESAGGTPAPETITIEKGQVAPQPLEMERDNCEFLGWFLNDELYNFAEPALENITLIAKWERIYKYYTVTFDANYEGADLIDSAVLREKSKAIAPNISRPGYTLLGWYVGEVKWNFYYEVVEDMDLVAKWEEIIPQEMVTLTFEAAGGTPAPETITIEKGQVASQPLEMEKDNYEFLGWFLNEALYNFDEPVQENIILIAKWQKIEPEPDPPQIDTEVFLNLISNYATEETIDSLVFENDVAKATYQSSNPDLYVIAQDGAYINKVYQTHQEQEVLVAVTITPNEGEIIEVSKRITLGPIVYQEINDTPIATYFYTQAMSFYKSASNHYNESGEIFTNLVKEELDIIYYSFVMPQADGTLNIENDSYIEEVKKLKKYDVRVLFTIDGVSQVTSDAFKLNTVSQEKIDFFVKNIMDLVDEYGFDGVDIDWEPFSGGVIPEQLDAFMIALKAEMGLRQAEGGTPYLLTTALPGGVGIFSSGYFNLETLGEVADYVNFMTYTMQYNNLTSHQTPISGGVIELLDFLSGIEFPLNKVIIGSGTYGKAYQLTSLGPDDPMWKEGSMTQILEYVHLGSFESGTLYVQAIEALINSGDYLLIDHYDEHGTLRGSYLYNEEKGIFVTYESELSAQTKIEIASGFSGMGVMTWAYSQDANNFVINALINARKNIE